MLRKEFEIEICAGNIESVIAADLGGANRVELCENLAIGGTTPSAGTIICSKEHANLDVFILIRPRPGDFVYSDLEFEVMKNDIRKCTEYDVDGIVIGCLKPNGTIDYDMCCRLIDAAKGLAVTFHRAFDVSRDPFEALAIIEKMGVSRILTSGQKNKAHQGLELLKKLGETAGASIKIMPGSGIDELNIQKIALETGLKSFHASLREQRFSKYDFQNSEIHSNGKTDIHENTYDATSPERVKTLIKKLEEI